MKIIVFLFFIICSLEAFAQDSSTLDKKCKAQGFNCGECDTNIQNDFNKILTDITDATPTERWSDLGKTQDNSNIKMKPGVTLEDTLQKIIDMMKKGNPAGENKINFVTIVESESTQNTSITNKKINPRIMVKSPNSELIVTFNTNPDDQGSKTLEIMRWNGKEGKYEFQELNFGEDGKPNHADLSGKKCMECHKAPSPRPNWDTYRAWAGVIPSRDDMLELDAHQGKFDADKDMQPDAKAYINFLDQVAAAKKDPKGNPRLKMLDIPFDEKVQLKEYVEGLQKPISEEKKVEIIKQHVKDKGFYRIRHYPDIESNDGSLAMNFDSKTAKRAGPSQFAFDQMLAQNMCRVATDLKNDPNFEKFKYALAGILKCGSRNYESLKNFLPENFMDQAKSSFINSRGSSMPELAAIEREISSDTDSKVLFQKINDDTNKSHAQSDQYKFNRHERFLNKYLTDVEGLSSSVANEEAKYYSENVVTPTQKGFHAITDPGGVRGVTNSDSDKISALRFLLEPFGVNVGNWSLVFGKPAYNSYSFSDQFPLLTEQPLFDEILKEAGSCENLETKSMESLKDAKIVMPEEDYMDSICNVILQEESNDVVKIIQPMLDVAAEAMFPTSISSLKKCVLCHGSNSGMPFPGISEFVNAPNLSSPNTKKFLKFLNSKNSQYKMTYIELFQYKLGSHGPNDYGAEMPPTEWTDNKEFASKAGIPMNNIQNIRRNDLSVFLTASAMKKSTDQLQMKELCESIYNVKNTPNNKNSSQGTLNESSTKKN